MANLGEARRKKANAQKGGALARVKQRKTNGPVPEPETLAALGVHQEHDFMVNGVRYHSPRFLGRINDRPWGSVDVTNGIRTYTLTNQFGSWMMPDADGYLKEPASLGLGGQLEVSANLIARFDAFLRDVGIHTAAQKRAAQEIEEKAKRQRPSKPKGALAKLKKNKPA